MRKHGNSLTRRNEVLILYSSIMVFLLALSYVLIITNPPSDLLRYDNNLGRAVTRDNLSVAEIPEHWGSISIFLGLFAFLTFFIGLSMSIVCEVEGESRRFAIILTTSLFLLIMLGLLLHPYYGGTLTTTVIPIGYLTGLLGLSLSKPLRARVIPTILITLGLAVTWIAFLFRVLSGLTAIVAIMVLMSLAVIWIELTIWGALKKKRRRRKGS